MWYIDKVIKGEDAFKSLMKRMRPTYPIEMCENTGRCGDIQFERFYAMGPQDDCYKEFYWLTMPCADSHKGAFTDGQHSQRRQEIYEGIRTGKITGK